MDYKENWGNQATFWVITARVLSASMQHCWQLDYKPLLQEKDYFEAQKEKK